MAANRVRINAQLSIYMAPTAPSWRSWYAIPLRLIVGYGFIEHGYAKLARGPDSLVAILLLGGFAVLIGAFIPSASIPMIIVLFVAIFTVHVQNGFSSIKLQYVDAAGAHFGQPGYETSLLYIAALFAMVIGGSGPLALDRLLVLRFARKTIRFRNDRRGGKATPNWET